MRQGCRIAPTLWNCYTLALFCEIARTVGAEWVQACVTMYADDLHSGQIFRSAEQLDSAICNLGHILDAIETLGLEISLQKTFVLLHICGTNCRKAFQRVVHHDRDGPYIQVPRCGKPPSKLRVKMKAKYLGVCVSYQNSETLTLKTRIAAAQKTFGRLKTWLCNKRLRLGFRLQLWHSCVFMTMQYGLFAVGLTMPAILKAQTVMLQMVRQIVGDHSYVTGHTHEFVLEEFGLLHPIALLIRSAEKLQQTLGLRLNQVTSSDVLLSTDWCCLQETIQMLHVALTLQTQVPLRQLILQSEQRPVFPCPWCNQHFYSLPNLRRHQTVAHHEPQLRTFHATAISYAVQGLPQCSHCLESFSTWRQFQIHLERNVCQVLMLGTTSRWTDQCHLMQYQDAPQVMQVRHLTLLLSKPYGSDVMDVLHRRAWPELARMQPATTDLTRSCILCGFFHSRPQELNLHLKTHHGQWVPHVFTKTMQLCKSQASISPCRFCGRKFQKSHMCPVLTQMSMLLVNLDVTGGQPGKMHPEVLKCSICMEQFDNHADVLRHLVSIHKLETQDWDPLRDMQGSDPVCAHCHACFGDMSAVRQHITMGQCACFDPLRPLQLSTVKDEWRRYIEDGTLKQLLEVPTQKQHLTLKCQLCGMSYQRSSDLSLHLQTVHAQHWQLSHRFHTLLLKTRQAVDGCYCNPKTHARGLSHSCPALRQLCMLAAHLKQDLFIPWKFTPKSLAQVVAPHLPGALLVQVLDSLCKREFSRLWTDPLILTALASQCLFCGGIFHTAALRDHVSRMHGQPGDLAYDLMAQLVPCLHAVSVNDHTCTACAQIYNSPPSASASSTDQTARSQLAQLHLIHQCPVALQIALLLTDGAHRCGDATDPGRPRDVRGLCTDEPSLGNVPKVHGGRKRQQKVTETRPSKPAKRSRLRRTVAEGDGVNVAETGCRAAGSEKARLLDMFHANRQKSSTSNPDSKGHYVEEDTGAERGHSGSNDSICAAEMPSLPGHGPATPGTIDSASVIECPGYHDADSEADRTAESGKSLPVSKMEPSGAEASSDLAISRPTSKNAEVCRAAVGSGAGSSGGDEISITQTCGQSPGDSVATPSLYEARRVAMLAANPAGQHSMESPGLAAEASHTSTEQAGHDTEDAHGEGCHEGQGEGQGKSGALQEVAAWPSVHQLCQCFERLKLVNVDNWCFINSAFLATTWALLSSHSFTQNSWGPHASQLAQFLMQSSPSDPQALADIPCFRFILASWSNRVEQGDPVEFLAHLLRGLEFSDFDMRWDNRIQIGSLTHIHDQNKDASTPLVLQFDPAHLDGSYIHVRQMVLDWSNQHGSQVGLITAPALLCLQIDRCVAAGDGTIQKTDIAVQVHGGCDIPVFAGLDLQIVWKEYHAVAQIAHMGQDNAGHCRSMLLTAPTSHGQARTLALLTEDWSKPTRICKAPYWFSRNITCIWLCRSDMLHLYTVPTSISD